jgi:transcriptional regulator with XRE-family HTH domain
VTKIKATLEAQGLTQTHLAQRANMHSTTVSRLVAGSAKAGPSIRSRVADALGINADKLFDADGWPLPATLEESRV